MAITLTMTKEGSLKVCEYENVEVLFLKLHED